MTILLCLALALTAADDGNLYSGAMEGDQLPEVSVDQYSATETARWPIPAGSQCLGIDYMGFWFADDVVGYVDNNSNTLYWMSTVTGSSVGTSWATDASNGSPFGMAHVPIAGDDDEVHVNDFSYDAVFYKEWDTSWTSYNALCDNMGRGMDYCADEDKIFELYTVADPGDYKWYVAMYTPGTSVGSSYQLDCNTSADWRGSGVTLFPKYGGETGIAVTMYDSAWIRFFDYPDHAGEVYYGYCVIPYNTEMSSSYGLTYSEDQDCFFHCWLGNNGFHYISRVEVTGAVLQQSTWGAIKSSF